LRRFKTFTKFKLAVLAIIALAALFANQSMAPNPALAPNCRVVHISDGDTFDVACNGSAKERIRIMGYDTPETYYAKCPAEKTLGDQATARLRTLTRNRELTRLIRHGHDRYGRVLAEIWLGDENLADIMVREGLAMRYTGGQRADWCAALAGGWGEVARP